MAATIATGLLASQFLLLFCTTATATVLLDGAVPPAPATVVGGSGLPKLPFPGGQRPRLPFPGGQPRLPFPSPDGLPHLPFPFPGGADCLNAVLEAESYVVDVFRALASPTPSEGVVSAGKACCDALQAVGDRCFHGVLPVSPLRALVGHACGGGLHGPGLLVPGPRV